MSTKKTMEITVEEYNKLKAGKEYGLLVVDAEQIIKGAVEVDKWFRNLILLEMNNVVSFGKEENDARSGARLRMLWEISGLFKKTFIK